MPRAFGGPSMDCKTTDIDGLDYARLADVLQAVKTVAEEIARPNAATIDREAVWPEEAIRALQAAGLGGLVVPREYGGLGHGLYALARCCEILGAECASTAICFGMHCVGSAVIAARVTEAQAEAYLRPIAEGRHLTTLALSEVGTGAHFYYPQCRLVRGRDGSLEIDGSKHFVTNGSCADSYVVSVNYDDDQNLPQFSCVVLDAGLKGLSWGERWQGFGMRGNESRALTIDRVQLSTDALLGAMGDQIWYVFNVVAPYFLTAMSGTYLGVATSALSSTRRHLMEREYKHDGRVLAEATVLQHRFGTVWGKLESARRIIYSAGQLFDSGDEDAVLSVLTSKAEVAEVATNVVGECMSLMGGIAYRDGSQIQRNLRDVRAAHVMAPTTDLLRIWTGRTLLGQPIFGE